MMLVTLDQVKERLRETEDDQDSDILSCASMASAIVVDYLKLKEIPPEWIPGEGVPPLIQAAVLEVAVEMFKNREASDGDLLSEKVTRILWRQRDPALA